MWKIIIWTKLSYTHSNGCINMSVCNDEKEKRKREGRGIEVLSANEAAARSDNIITIYVYIYDTCENFIGQ